MHKVGFSLFLFVVMLVGATAVGLAQNSPQTKVLIPPRIDAKRCPSPTYPALSRRNKEEGTVVLDLEIFANGKVSKTKIAEASSFSRLNSAAEGVAKKWILIPAKENGKPVAGSLRVSFVFRLEKTK